ncbi:Gcd10p-domain-containing protein [Peniophora sp. CONT]|nr:Gcd10p-domain-containing protein [Peniophora sp. CONT]
MSTGEGESSSIPTIVPSAPRDRYHIHEDDYVMFRLPNGEVRSHQVKKNGTLSMGRLGQFSVNNLIGQPYGLTHEIVGKDLNVLPPRSIEDIEDTEATNELINDGQMVQPLTGPEIEALKQSGVHASEIIKKQIEAHSNYELKTEYSKDKYKKRKEAKFLKAFTTVEPTIYNIAEYWFNKDPGRIRDMRVDTLSQMLNLGNIRPGGRYLAVDDVSGIMVTAMLERLGGEGRLITICDVDSPPAYPAMSQMNFSKEFTSVMASLNWATAEEEYTPVALLPDPAQDDIRSDKHKVRMSKRKAVSDALAATRDELFAGEFAGLFIASHYDPASILARLSPYLGGSASIVVYSQHLQIVTDLQNKMRADSQYLAPSVTESWLRRYQVLPGRTHPTMVTSGSGGYLLHATKM